MVLKLTQISTCRSHDYWPKTISEFMSATPVRQKVSSTSIGCAWLKQFRSPDQSTAAALLDALLLLNENEVAAAILRRLTHVARESRGKRRRVALYAEREIAKQQIFKVVRVKAADGQRRLRAVEHSGPPAVKPIRGSSRVGSEGWIAFLISQAVKAHPRIYQNHPGPDRIRGGKVSSLVIVTDFIGSGDRVQKMLQKFWNVPSVRSWHSLGWINFGVVAAAGTARGIDAVKEHRLKPWVEVEHIVPTLETHEPSDQADRWRGLLAGYHSRLGRDDDPTGYGGAGALVAFSYGFPNNAPPLLHMIGRSWKPLCLGPIPDELRSAFGLPERRPRLISKLKTIGPASIRKAVNGTDLNEAQAAMVLFLSAIRGRFRTGAEVEVADRTGLTTPEVMELRKQAAAAGWLTIHGRLTDNGQKLVASAGRVERRKSIASTNTEPYYPLSLRAPGAKSRIRRP
jgi:hypothetical protein